MDKEDQSVASSPPSQYIQVPQIDRRLEAVVAGSIDGAFCLETVADPSANSQSLVISTINQPATRLFETSADRLIGRSFDDLTKNTFANAVSPRLTELLKTGQSSEFEAELTVAGMPCWLELQLIPFPDGVFVLARDITTTRRAHAALGDSQEYLSSVIANAPIIIYELDPNGIFKLSAGRSLEQIGLIAGEAVGQSIFNFFPEDSPEVVAFRQAADGQTVTTQTQLGSGYFTSRYSPRYDDKGNIVGVLGVSYDITEQFLAEQRLQQAQKLEAVGQLTGGIAHDFNNLLAVIMGNLDLLQSHHELDDAANNLLDRAMSAISRGSVLTKRLLAFSRQQLLSPRTTDVVELINGMLELLARTLSENISITFKADQGIWPTHIDPSQLENAILNLCVNARDAMPTGGELSITAANVRISDVEGQRLSLTPGYYIKVIVSDTGCGIPDEHQPLVFEPFFSTKEPGKGSGLGLSMVYGFVDQSGGTVELDSRPGEGSRFTLFLPRASTEQQPHSEEQHVHQLVLEGKGERILVVEDDPDVRQFVVTALDSLNYEVSQASNASEALDILAGSNSIDVIFSDIVLPGSMSGINLVKQAEAKHADLKVLLTTGYAQDNDPANLASLAHYKLISKPYQISELSQALRNLLDPHI